MCHLSLGFDAGVRVDGDARDVYVNVSVRDGDGDKAESEIEGVTGLDSDWEPPAAVAAFGKLRPTPSVVVDVAYLSLKA